MLENFFDIFDAFNLEFLPDLSFFLINKDETDIYLENSPEKM